MDLIQSNRPYMAAQFDEQQIKELIAWHMSQLERRHFSPEDVTLMLGRAEIHGLRAEVRLEK